MIQYLLCARSRLGSVLGSEAALVNQGVNEGSCELVLYLLSSDPFHPRCSEMMCFEGAF